MYNPVSTYRIQFNKHFTFSHFEKVIPYLHKLGVVTVYASPILEAMPGSMHGYDVINAARINPEIGTLDEFRKISTMLKSFGMGWLQDIVPNHMALHVNNPWFRDVLANGSASAYAKYFDMVDPLLHKVMLPVLVESIDDMLQAKKVKLEQKDGKTELLVGEMRLPVNAESLPGEVTYDRLQQINSNSTELANLINLQHYSLCLSGDTSKQISYRRFFTVNDLICLNMQHEEVFNQYHEFVISLVREGLIQGLRIDHIDGLYNPAQYLRRLRNAVGSETYITVEKILQPSEISPADWPVQGNTGYDFLGMVNRLLVNRHSFRDFNKFYEAISGHSREPESLILEKKSLILHEYMSGELDNLVVMFKELFPVSSTVDSTALRKGIAMFLILFPVYRHYGSDFPLDRKEASHIEVILNRMKKLAGKDKADSSVAKLLENVLLTLPSTNDQMNTANACSFYMRCMQFTGPLMAKGVEDTLMYSDSMFIGHNEVGDSPSLFGSSRKKFHHEMQLRQAHEYLSLNTTSTHDTKRGEDVRARLSAITDFAEPWKKLVNEWMNLVQDKMLSSTDTYFILQTMVGALPYAANDYHIFAVRMKQYMQKALREAKVHSSWAKFDEVYEKRVEDYIDMALSPASPAPGLLEKFRSNISDAAIIHSLSQLFLRFVCPGIPDTYQGTELWDLSLVDPDNRGSVNYNVRETKLDKLLTLNDPHHLIELWNTTDEGDLKLWLMHHLLQERKAHVHTFTYGSYKPLRVRGRFRKQIIAFVREYRNETLICITVIHAGGLKGGLKGMDWEDTRVIIEESLSGDYANAFGGNKSKYKDSVNVQDLLKALPVALLKRILPEAERAAGVLLPLYALPSSMGMGDMGDAARHFADDLLKSGQKLWQMLPLNPVEKSHSWSPYSSTSGMAGNPLFISLDGLATMGLLAPDALSRFRMRDDVKVNYDQAAEIKYQCIQLAFAEFQNTGFRFMQEEFKHYCSDESSWLNDFALYTVLRQHHGERAWNEWPEEFKIRQKHSIEFFEQEHQMKLQQVKWEQFIFARQWKELRAYCNNRGIRIFGDMPFYVSYDSADVWAHPEIFTLDDKGEIQGVAGVPPDYFSADGQLWGMPTFRWDILKQHRFKWWIERLKKNFELFDLVRLDHFRAFVTYWEVPAGEKTARNGKWLDGPGTDFFETVTKELRNAEFIAEDLGDRMEAVYAFRDKLGLPGMRVLQFAFGDNINESVDIPHVYPQNCVVYAGTHDNNTTVGWYRNEADEAVKQRLNHYTGIHVKESDIHEVLAQLAYASVAKYAIISMQDLLALNEKSRTNTPGTSEGNWMWKLKNVAMSDELCDRLLKMTKLYGRL